MLSCVVFVAYPDSSNTENSLKAKSSISTNGMYAIGFGLLAPFFISIFISISRKMTVNYGYNS